jgi:hypothetical protein
MNSNSGTDGLFPFSSGSPEHTHLGAPRLLSGVSATPGFVMGNRTFMRAWAARRAARNLAQSTAGGPRPESIVDQSLANQNAR